MATVKVALIGAGSYTFGPSIIKQTVMENRLDDVELALVDLDVSMLNLMADAGKATARSLGVKTRFSTHTDRKTALAGADFVICSAAVQGGKRFAMDCEVVNRLSPGHLISEFGGIAGISYSLRQINLISQIVADMRQCCPDSWLLNVCNPLPRVCQAAHEMGAKTAGFCSFSSVVYSLAWKLFHGLRLPYPAAEAREKWAVKMGGLNHFTWLLEMTDRSTGDDVLPLVRQKLQQGGTMGNPHCERIMLETGFLLLPSDDHVQDFLPPVGLEHSRTDAFHGDPQERRDRVELLKNVAAGNASLSQTTGDAWERPMDLIAAMAFGKTAEFHSINLINRGQITNLPEGVFVETPASGSTSGPVPQQITLPASVLPICRHTAEVTDTIVRAAMQKSRKVLHDAVELDPTIVDKAAGQAAIDECLRAHSDILPQYS